MTVEPAQMAPEIAAVWNTYLDETAEAREVYDQAVRAAKQANSLATAQAHAEHAIALDDAWESYHVQTTRAFTAYMEATRTARSARDYGVDALRGQEVQQ